MGNGCIYILVLLLLLHALLDKQAIPVSGSWDVVLLHPPFLFVLAMLPQSLIQLNEVNSMISKYGLLITIAYPGILLIIAILRKKRCSQMIGEIYSGYLDVAILIWLFSGLFNLFIDTNKYRQSNMAKENKVSRVLGWINISIVTVWILVIVLVKVFL